MYLKAFPRPYRNEAVWTGEAVAQCGFWMMRLISVSFVTLFTVAILGSIWFTLCLPVFFAFFVFFVAIKRYGSAILPMDEALMLCAVDLSGRPYLVFDVPYTVTMLGDMQTELFHEFFYAVSYAGAMNLHLKMFS